LSWCSLVRPSAEIRRTTVNHLRPALFDNHTEVRASYGTPRLPNKRKQQKVLFAPHPCRLRRARDQAAETGPPDLPGIRITRRRPGNRNGSPVVLQPAGPRCRAALPPIGVPDLPSPPCVGRATGGSVRPRRSAARGGCHFRPFNYSEEVTFRVGPPPIPTDTRDSGRTNLRGGWDPADVLLPSSATSKTPFLETPPHETQHPPTACRPPAGKLGAFFDAKTAGSPNSALSHLAPGCPSIRGSGADEILQADSPRMRAAEVLVAPAAANWFRFSRPAKKRAPPIAIGGPPPPEARPPPSRRTLGLQSLVPQPVALTCASNEKSAPGNAFRRHCAVGRFPALPAPLPRVEESPGQLTQHRWGDRNP